MATIREAATASMTHYLVLAATGESSDVSEVFSSRGSRSWERHYPAGVSSGEVESVTDELARTAGAGLGEAQAILLAGDGSTVAGQWALRDSQGQTIGYYRGLFHRQRGDWRLLNLEVFGVDTPPTSLVAYCHVVGDVSPGVSPVVRDMPAPTPATEQTEAAPATQ